MDQLPLTLPIQATAQRRRGRPPGVKNKRSLDLGRYIEAMFGGSTPGQQSAQLCLVTPADLKRAKAEARELQVIDVDLAPLTLAMVVKAKKLARAIGCTSTEAWLLLAKERAELMAYVHQKQPQAAAAPKGAAATVFMVPEHEQQQLEVGAPDTLIDFVEETGPRSA